MLGQFYRFIIQDNLLNQAVSSSTNSKLSKKKERGCSKCTNRFKERNHL